MSDRTKTYIVYPIGNQIVICGSVEKAVHFLKTDVPKNWTVEVWDGKHSDIQNGDRFLADAKRLELVATMEAVEREHKQRMDSLKKQLAELSQ